ncbi:MAG TPA: hypothetical protein DCY25_11760 [Bacteroidales bacterium]|nr:hypothetical protein [Bacteroidales bacterium]
MKDINNTGKYTDRDWEELAAHLSGERTGNSELLSRFAEEDKHNTVIYWKELREMNKEKEINVDQAWDKLYSRLKDNGLISEPAVRRRFFTPALYRVAAALLLLLGIGSALLYMNNKDLFGSKIVVATTEDQKNLEVTLPDGSIIFLNRNTQVTYSRNFGERERSVALTGEAWFDVARDESKPFTVDAGKAMVRVLGTSFNVRTSDQDSPVEVFVRTGQVMVTGTDENEVLVLDPGYIGTVYPDRAERSVNTDPNYLSWNTGLLVYDGQTLDIVFRDLKKVYNMDIVADDPEILSHTWTSPIDNQPQETIIRLICASFNLGYAKDGDVYHLKRK